MLQQPYRDAYKSTGNLGVTKAFYNRKCNRFVTVRILERKMSIIQRPIFGRKLLATPQKLLSAEKYCSKFENQATK